MEEHQEELATIESIDSGAVYTLALKTHVGMSIQTFRYFAGWCDKIQVGQRSLSQLDKPSPDQWNLLHSYRAKPSPSTKPGPTATWPSQRKSLWGEVLRLLNSPEPIHCFLTDCFFVRQSLCHSHPLELPPHDAGLEKCSLSGSWKHASAEASSGEDFNSNINHLHLLKVEYIVKTLSGVQDISHLTVFICLSFIGDSSDGAEVCWAFCESWNP